MYVSSIRQQTENVLFGDIEFALSKTVEERLWTHIHYRVIDDYRKRIANVSPLLSKSFSLGSVDV